MKPRLSRVWLIPLVLALSGPLRAEFNLDFSIGAAFTQDVRVEAKDEIFGTKVTEDTSIDATFTLGGRMVYWVDPVPWFGFAFDFSYFRAEGGPIDRNDIFPTSFLFMGRATLLRSRRLPYGALQPYIGVGPSIVFTDAEIDQRPDIRDRVTDSSSEIGLDARAGIAWEFIPHVAVFAEYRFLYFEQHLDNGDDCNCSITTATSRATYATHFALIGISYRF